MSLLPPEGAVLEDVVGLCSTSLHSQSTESMMPISSRCARRLQCPVRNPNIVVCSCLATQLIGSVVVSVFILLFRVSFPGICCAIVFLSLFV